MSIDQTERTAERPPEPVGPAFELLESKLRGPIPRRVAVPRKELVDRLISSREVPVVAVLAGPGYGKTTLIAQWADADERPFVWVSLDERDNDAVVFLTYTAAALDRLEPIPPAVFQGLSSAGAGIETVLVPRLAAALSRMTVPLVLVFDDVHVLRNRACLDAMAMLVSSLPAGSQIALAGRAATGPAPGSPAGPARSVRYRPRRPRVRDGRRRCPPASEWRASFRGGRCRPRGTYRGMAHRSVPRRTRNRGRWRVFNWDFRGRRRRSARQLPAVGALGSPVAEDRLLPDAHVRARRGVRFDL